MAFNSEIKTFIKNTLLLTFFFTLAIYLLRTYIISIVPVTSNAWNEYNYEEKWHPYLGTTAVALGMNLGMKETLATTSPVNLSNEALSISEAVAIRKPGEYTILTANMEFIHSYANVLKTDILALLDQNNDRAVALEEHIALLRNFLDEWQDRIALLSQQYKELQGIINENSSEISNSKTSLQQAYQSLDYDTMETNIDGYMAAKQWELYAKTYLTFINSFLKNLNTLQIENKKILDTLVNNREALIKRTVVVLPDSGTDVLKKLNLIQTEEEYNGKK